MLSYRSCGGLVSPQLRLPSIQVVRSRAARAVRTEVLERKLTFTVSQWAATTQAKHGVIVRWWCFNTYDLVFRFLVRTLELESF
jgi:hypothetical protein